MVRKSLVGRHRVVQGFQLPTSRTGSPIETNWVNSPSNAIYMVTCVPRFASVVLHMHALLATVGNSPHEKPRPALLAYEGARVSIRLLAQHTGR